MIDHSNYKTIKQIADEIGVSKAALQKRISRDSLNTRLSPYISMINGTKYIDTMGENIIKEAFAEKPFVKPVDRSDVDTGIDADIDGNDDGNTHISMSEIDNSFIELLREQQADLRKQLEIKDKQLEIKDKQIDELQGDLRVEREHSRQQADKLAELTRNSQILLKQEQDKIALLLPDQPLTVSSDPDEDGMEIKQRPFWQFWKKR